MRSVILPDALVVWTFTGREAVCLIAKQFWDFTDRHPGGVFAVTLQLCEKMDLPIVFGILSHSCKACHKTQELDRDTIRWFPLQVIKLMQSFKSRELVTELFAWRHYYWFLTDEGIEYLRVYLNLPSEIVPATLKKSTRPLEKDGGRPPRRDYGDRPPRREGGFGGDRR